MRMKCFLMFWMVGDMLALEDLIIERRPHHVDWDDLFMEYDRYSAPNHENQQITINLDFIVLHSKSMVFEMTQRWKDDRLRFVGDSYVSVPPLYLPWTPDTYIRNGVNENMSKSSLRLNYDGTFQLRQKYQIDYNDQNIIIGSFDNYGTGMVTYVLTNWTSSSNVDNVTSEVVFRELDDMKFQDLFIYLNTTLA